MHTVSIDVERFAYDVFRINWIKCSVPRNDIPFYQRTENRYPRKFIRSISKYVMFYQVLIRNDIKLLMVDGDIFNVDDEFSMFEFFNLFMKVDKDLFIYQPMQNVACSLAICLELTLHKYPAYRRLLGPMSGRWRIYFEQFLQLDFFLNGGFDGLFKHAESMHNSDYTLDKYIYESNRVSSIGSSLWTNSHVSIFLEENKIKIDDEIRRSTISILNYCTRSENSRFSRMLCRSEMLPVVGKWIRRTRKRIGRIGSSLFGRRSRRAGGLLGSSNESESSESSTEERRNRSEVSDQVVYSMIQNYILSVQEYHRER